jgi:hypothetical protein
MILSVVREGNGRLVRRPALAGGRWPRPDWRIAQISGRLDELFKRSFASRSG